MPINCDNPRNDQERSLCSCSRATDALSSALKTYETRLAEYSANKAEYQRKYQEFQNSKGDYDRRANQERDRLAREEAGMACGGCGTSQHCWHGWYQVGEGRCGFANAGCYRICKRNNDWIDRDFGTWKAANSEPIPPVDSSGESPQAPSNMNIQCCSQIFSDIKTNGGNVDFSNVNQDCSQRINERLNANDPPPSPAVVPPPLEVVPPSPPEEIKNDGIIILFILLIVLCCSIFMSSSFGIIVFNSKK